MKPVAAPAGKNAVGLRPTNGAARPDDDPANGGVRREPGLERHKDIAPEPVKAPVNEFDPDADKPQRDADTNRTMVREMRLMARRIAMDRGDGMEL